MLIGFRILATSKDYVKINFLPQYQLVEFNKSTSSTDKSVTSTSGGEVKNILYQAMRIMVQIKATLVLKKILVYIEVHEFSE